MKMKILIISGTHGNELSAVQAGLALKRHYKDDFYITVIPFLNEPGLLNNSREVTSAKTTDLNRSFKEELKHSDIVGTVKELVCDHDVIIDIHNSPRCANFCLIDKGFNDNVIKRLCYLSKVEYAVRYSKGGTIKDYVNSNDRIGITYEFAGMTTLNNQSVLDHAINDIIQLVSTIQKNGLSQNELNLDDQMLVDSYCTTKGFIDFLSDINETVKPKQKLFNVIDESGNVIETVFNQNSKPIKIIAVGHSFQEKGSAVLQYIIKDDDED